MLPRALSDTNANPEIFTEAEAIAGRRVTAPKGWRARPRVDFIFYASGKHRANGAKEYRLEAYATLFFWAVERFPEPSGELSPSTNSSDAMAQYSIGF